MALLSPGKISLIPFTQIKTTLRSKLPTLNEGVPATAGGVVSVADPPMPFRANPSSASQHYLGLFFAKAKKIHPFVSAGNSYTACHFRTTI
ncbi:MAG: hypothetical protein EBT55_01565 [Proteobacteria bacterium]|nr:hypothetical protein [Pseudomonadota bacterium]